MIRRVVRMVAGLLLVAGCSAPDPAPRSAPILAEIMVIPAGERAAAPELRGELLDGTPYNPAEYVGEILVINFWGSWCAPCVAEAEELEQTHRATRSDGVSFVGINVRDTRGAASQFVLGRVTYPSIFDPESRLALGFEVPPVAIPSTVVLDRQGRVAAMANGAVTRSRLEPALNEIAAERSMP